MLRTPVRTRTCRQRRLRGEGWSCLETEGWGVVRRGDRVCGMEGVGVKEGIGAGA